jgi:hypothetical protein
MQARLTVPPGKDDDAETALARRSVWIEGRCRKSRVEAGARVDAALRRGWTLVGASGQVGMLGESVSEALPTVVADTRPLIMM